MVRILNSDAWNEFVALLPKKAPRGAPTIPEKLALEGIIDIGFWVPGEPFWADMRVWLTKTGQASVYYFLLEGIKGENTFFEIDVCDLNEDEIEKLNVGYRCAIAGKNFDWVVSSDDEKQFYVASDVDLFELLEQHKARYE